MYIKEIKSNFNYITEYLNEKFAKYENHLKTIKKNSVLAFSVHIVDEN
jgi:hypothetical protein